MKYENHKLRHELKYLINYRDYHVLRERLAVTMKRDSHSNPDYFIRSLYFDDARDSAYHDKNSGVFQRKKYRIRTYNKSKEPILLEQKRKFGEYISKTSSAITYDEYIKILCGDVSFAMAHENSLLRAFYVEYRSFLLRPTVVVDYDREAFVCKEGNVRITFDRDLHCGFGSLDIFDENLITAPAFDRDKLIMEVKYDDFLPKSIKKMLNPAANRMALSKYVICRDYQKIYSGGIK